MSFFKHHKSKDFKTDEYPNKVIGDNVSSLIFKKSIISSLNTDLYS